jgi:hypothetical protein
MLQVNQPARMVDLKQVVILQQRVSVQQQQR